MASLLLPDDDPATPSPLLQLPDERPPSLQPDPRADALGQTYRDITDYMAQKQQESVDQGYWAGGGLLEGGHPTLKAFNSAADEYAQGLLFGTTSSGGKPSFTTYQGSPYKFAPTPKNPLGEFSNEKIGTGTGAQTEGYAHYTAENENVAKAYREGLSSNPTGPEVDAYNALNDAFKAKAAELSKARLLEKPVSDDFLAEIDALRKQKLAAQAAIPPSGHMYEVKINADPEKYLHWDKPLSEQHPEVQTALRDLGVTSPDITGQQAYYQLAGRETGSNPQVADALREAGVPGVRYFDAGSKTLSAETAMHQRSAAEARQLLNADPNDALAAKELAYAEGELARLQKRNISHNYATFDPATMEIIRRYGLAGLMLGGGGLHSPNKQEQ